MFLKQSKSHGKIYLSFVQGYRDEKGKIKHRTIEKIGFLDDLSKKFDNPIQHFKDVAKQKTNGEITEYTIKNLNTKIIDDNSHTKNLGYVILKKVYNELNISNILKQKQSSLNIEYSLDEIMSFF